MRTVVIASKNWYTTFYRACQRFLLLVFVYHYFKDWKHIRNFQSVSWNTLWSIEKKYSVNHDRIIILSDLVTLHVEITSLSPALSHKMPFQACMARIIVAFYITVLLFLSDWLNTKRAQDLNGAERFQMNLVDDTFSIYNQLFLFNGRLRITATKEDKSTGTDQKEVERWNKENRALKTYAIFPNTEEVWKKTAILNSLVNPLINFWSKQLMRKLVSRMRTRQCID